MNAEIRKRNRKLADVREKDRRKPFITVIINHNPLVAPKVRILLDNVCVLCALVPLSTLSKYFFTCPSSVINERFPPTG